MDQHVGMASASTSASENSFAHELNPAQARAVGCTRGPLLVFAGAGSGKTRVITYRIAHLVATYRVAPYRILAVTFTNKAAGEMRTRLERLLGADLARDLCVGTFHATCARLLRRYGQSVGLGQNFVIYDDADQRAVVTRVLKQLDLDDRRYPVRLVLSRIHREKQEGRGPEEMIRKDFADDQILRVYERYEQHLREANAVDFEDLLLRMTRLVESSSEEADELCRRFQYVLVDEFQDTNHIQYRFVRRLAHLHRNLCVVGDDDQSIYRWRGADVRNIRGFSEDFPEANVIKLEQNYRSTARIVRAALAVIKPARDREPKELWTENEDGARVVVAATASEREEAAFLTGNIRELISKGTPPNEIAVFYRIHAQSRVLEEALRLENIPYQIVGGTKFFERAEIKDLLSYLRVILNPQSDVDLLRIINVPARGIGKSTIDRLVAISDEKRTSVFDALETAGLSVDIGTAAKKRLTALRALLVTLRDRAFAMDPAAAAELVLEETGYMKTLQAEDSAESDARIENLRELLGSILDYEAEAKAAGENPTLGGYLERVTLASDVDQMKDAPRVVMMTVHGAKGLEFRYVFLTGMEDELFPYKGLQPGQEDELEEERRLAYVAITRAREQLFITHAMVRMLFGQTRYSRPSRFLSSLPQADLELVSTVAVQGTTRFVDREDWSSPPRRGDWEPSQRGESAQAARGEWKQSQRGESAQAARGDRAPAEDDWFETSEDDSSGPPRQQDSSQARQNEWDRPPQNDWTQPRRNDSARPPRNEWSTARRNDPARPPRDDWAQRSRAGYEHRSGAPEAPGARSEIDLLRSPGERYVDRSAFDDVPPETSAESAPTLRVRPGSRVQHARFGIGEVRSVQKGAEMIVVAYFPGWGEKKILARFLSRAS